VLFAFDNAGTGNEEQFAAADLEITDFEDSCQLSVPSYQFKTFFSAETPRTRR
jgi:hypothetical protein